LVGATASFVVREGWPEAMPEAQVEAFRQALNADSTQQLKRFSSLIHQGAAQPREAQRYLDSSTDASTDTSDAGLKASLDLLTQTDLRPLLNDVRQPVLLVHGAADTLMPLAAAEHLMLALPDARLEVFGGSAHAPFASDPARFVESVQRFAGMLE
jgi:pimeloyl-[acyl-carrier protein] methyl ester esterase